MTYQRILVLSVLAACGPANAGSESSSASGSESESESDSDSDSASSEGSTGVVPTSCEYEGSIYENGETFEVGDNCFTYLCDSGALVVQQDNRTTVAGDLDLANQQEVDAQSCLMIVEGSLTISGTAADLTRLRQLVRVGGTLDISASDAVTLTGLEGISEVGAGIVIAQNPQLTTLAFMPYMSVFGDVTIDDNDALVSLAGAGFIGQCATCSIGEGEGTTGTDEDPGGDSGVEEGGAEPDPTGDTGEGNGQFYGNIVITNNDVLSDISALRGLGYAWASVRFRNNAALTSLAALRLVQVEGDLEIAEHVALSDADAQAFAAAVDVAGVRTVCGNLGGAACLPPD
jgi:hypothetical protein